MRDISQIMGTVFLLSVFLNLFLLNHFALASITRNYKFEIKVKNVTRLCKRTSILTVNGKFPGPPIIAREDDRLVVKVVNPSPKNISIHWHGIRQIQTGWYDGPAYITQCPIGAGQTYVYNFTILQRGTLFYHAHMSWLRATLYGTLIILPKLGVLYPFPKPYKQLPFLFGEWFGTDPDAIVNQSLQTGAGPNVSLAHTINGLPGPLYNCSAKDTYKLKVMPGKTYLLRLINAALNDELFISIANHTVTVVEADATTYIKPFQTDTFLLTPGQTMNVLLHTKPTYPNTTFFILARPYSTAATGTFDNTTTAAILHYETPKKHSSETFLLKPILPAINDTLFVVNFSSKFRSLASAEYPANVPKTVSKRFFFTVGLGTSPCPENRTCQGPNGTKFAASFNNAYVSLAQLPDSAVLQSYFFGKSHGVYTTDFPANPVVPFDYTGMPPNNTMVVNGTKAVVVPFNASVKVVLQDTSVLGNESHPLHLHGFNFFVLASGFGNFDWGRDSSKFNLVDPVERNTVGVPSGGWTVIRFRANNPGVWFMHCHFDVHLSWGLRMVWIVLDGFLPNQKLPPHPPDLPKC